MAAPVKESNLEQWLRLGRVSNLPTVWSNSLAAAALGVAAQAHEQGQGTLLVGCALVMSTFYVAGMVLNDAFDAEYDAKHRPTRPIPSGAVSRLAAFWVGGTGLGLGTFGLAALAWQRDHGFWAAGGWGLLLAACILVYDLHHKGNAYGPLIMGGCRALVLLGVGWVTEGCLSLPVTVAAGLQFLYVVGLTHAAKQEDLRRPGSFWPLALILVGPLLGLGLVLTEVGFSLGEPHHGVILLAVALQLGSSTFAVAPLLERPKRIGLAVGRLIAGVAMLDALIIATTGWWPGVALAMSCAVLTLAGQRLVPGT